MSVCLYLCSQSVLYMGEEAEEVAEEEESPDGGAVSISALLDVVCHSGSKTACHNRFQTNQKSKEEYTEVRTADIYRITHMHK